LTGQNGSGMPSCLHIRLAVGFLIFRCLGTVLRRRVEGFKYRGGWRFLKKDTSIRFKVTDQIPSLHRLGNFHANFFSSYLFPSRSFSAIGLLELSTISMALRRFSRA
jgi:hypothetical protein